MNFPGVFMKHRGERANRMAALMNQMEVRQQRLDHITAHLDEMDDQPLRSMLSAALEGCPLPAWLKNQDGVMLWCNETYTSRYGEYIMGKDSDLWPVNVALGFDINDQKVKDTGRPVFCFEQLPDGEQLAVVKWPIVHGNSSGVMVAGIGIGTF